MLTQSDSQQNGHSRTSRAENNSTTHGSTAVAERSADDPLATTPLAIRLNETAPSKVREAFALADFEKGWEHWAKYLGKRRLASPAKLLPTGGHSLAWGLAECLGKEAAANVTKQAAEIAAIGHSDGEEVGNVLFSWLEATARSPVDVHVGMQSLAWARALPALAKRVRHDLWARLLNELVRISDESGKSPAADPLVHQLTAGELPLTLAYQLPEIETCRQLGPAGLKALTGCLAEILDGEGLPNCRHLAVLRGLLACWTRCRALGRNQPELRWDDASQAQFCWVVRHALRLTRPDGSQMLAPAGSGKTAVRLFHAACYLATDAEADQLFELAIGKKKSAHSRHKLGKKTAKAAPAVESEWTELAILRSDWAKKSPSLGVSYGERTVRCELAIGSQLLLAGSWQATLSVNGAACTQTSEWQQVCWVSDDDIDYLELEADFTGGVRIQRQVLLGRQDQFLLLADAVLGTPHAARLDYRSSLTLADGARFEPADETREGWLKGADVAAVVLPLALSEWRTDTRGGALTTAENSLQLCQSASGQATFAPLFFGLDRKWRDKELTWRQLSVAELRQNLPAEAAVGYRVQIGKKQWLIYRSLAQAGTRTVLGQNVSSEYLVGRFYKDGHLKTYVDIEY